MKKNKVTVVIILVLLATFLFACDKDTDFSVNFDGNGGEYISGEVSQTIEYGNAAKAPVFTKEGYTLTWDKAFNNITETTTVTVVWTIKTYTVTFDGDAGTYISGDEVQTIEHGGSATVPVYEKEGYTLSWNKDFDNVTQTTNVTAVWTIKTYTVTFDGNGGTLISGDETQTIEHGDEATAPIYEKEGYTLSWDKSFDNIIGTTTISAVWTIKTYTVTFDGNGGTLISGDEEQMTEYGGSAMAPIYEKDGYSLSWDKDFDSIIENTVISAIWTIKTYTVTFDGNGGELISGDEDQTIEHGSEATAPFYEKDGYSLSWDKGFVSIIENTVISAIWTIKTYTVTFDGNGGELISGEDEQTIEHGSAATAPVYEKEGYMLSSWDKSFDSIKETTIITAVWSIKTYTVTFNGNGGTLISGDETQTVEHGSTAIAPVHEKEGYTLSWDKAFDSITETTIVTAIWTIKTYTVTFNGNGGTLISGNETQTVEHGSAATAPLYEREGYNFYGWDISFDNIKAPITISAVWLCYTIQLYKNINGAGNLSISNGSGIIIDASLANALVTVESEVTITASTNLGYTWLGWYEGDTKVSEDTCLNYTFTMPAENKVLMAKWQANIYSVILDVNGGTYLEENTVEVIYGSPFVLDVTMKTNHYFIGWYKGEGDTGIKYTDSQGYSTKNWDINSDLTILYARWVKSEEAILNSFDLQHISLSGTYHLVNNIDLMGEEWNPIGSKNYPFTGIFDGNGYTISNFTITTTSKEHIGFFGNIKGTIMNLGITEFTINVSNIQNPIYVGGLAGSNVTGTITNCFTSGIIRVADSRPAYIGGLVGTNSGTIFNSYSICNVTATVNNDAYVGGLVGRNISTISNSYSMSDVTAIIGSGKVGGLVGENYNGTITYCHTKGAIETSSNSFTYAGGLVGYNDSGAIINSYVSGSVNTSAGVIFANVDAFVGGLIGYSINSTINNSYATGSVSAIAISGNCSAYAGGLVGSGDNYVINNSYAKGDVVATSSSGKYAYAGGLTGYGGTITNCFATGDISANNFATSSNKYGSYAGGLTGSNATITNCYATGNVNATSSLYTAYAGGLVGLNESCTLTNSYATGNVSARVTSMSSNYNAYSGGLVGWNKSKIINSYATGSVSITMLSTIQNASNAYVGGVAGRNSGFVTNSYRYDGQVFYKKVGSNEYSVPSNTLGEVISLADLQTETWITQNLNWGKYISQEDLLVNPNNVWMFITGQFQRLYLE